MHAEFRVHMITLSLATTANEAFRFYEAKMGISRPLYGGPEGTSDTDIAHYSGTPSVFSQCSKITSMIFSLEQADTTRLIFELV